MDPAIAILELASIARGIRVGDAMVKRSPLDVLRAGTVHPGRYLVLAGGLTADVQEAIAAGREAAGDGLLDLTFLPDVHPDVVATLGGVRREGGEALGVVETSTVAAAVQAADAGLKHADVTLRDLRLADDLGGKGYALFAGPVSEVEVAVDEAVARVTHAVHIVEHLVIAQLHEEMDALLVADARFLPHLTDARKGG